MKETGINYLRILAWVHCGPTIAASAVLLLALLVGWPGVIALAIAIPSAFVGGLYLAPRFRHRLFEEN